MSATPDRISSTGSANLISESLENNSRSGNGYTQVFEGSLKTMLQQRSASLFAGATHVKTESMRDGNYQVTAFFPWDVINGSNAEAPVVSHELENNMNQVEVWSNPKLRADFLTEFGSILAANSAINFVLMQINSFIAAGDGSASTQATAEAKITSTYSGSQQTLLLDVFRGVAYHQIKNSIQFDTVYRKRVTAATPNQVTASYTGAGQIWTTAEIISFENIPSSTWFVLPPNFLWFKTQPNVQDVSNQKSEVSYTYMAVAEAWARLYTPYSSATLITFA